MQISAHHKGIIDRYASHRLQPGQGFFSILANDIDWARLDTTTINNISNIIAYIREVVPAEAHGSAEAVNAWLSGRKF
jgi:hypothetical protein